MIERACEEGEIHAYAVKRGYPKVSHLMFADDCLLFAYNKGNRVQKILEILDTFQNATGQRVSFPKSSILFSPNFKTFDRDFVLQQSKMTIMDPKCRYLGLPSVWGRGKKEALQFVIEKVRQKVQGWRGKFLLQAGREILLKAVATTIPTYVMQVLRLPSTFCDDLNMLLCKFWWRSTQIEKNATHSMNWKKMARNKDKGGMGFRDFNEFNKALLGKQAWTAIQNPTALWVRLLKSIYCPYHELFEAKKVKKGSWVWNSFYEGLQVLRLGARWNVSNGKKIFIWQDPWLPTENGFKVRSPDPQYGGPYAVRQLIKEDRQWNEEMINKFFNEEEGKLIKSIPIDHEQVDDTIVWHYTNHGYYSMSSAYNLIRERQPVVDEASSCSNVLKDKDFWSQVWGIDAHPRIKNFLWRAMHNSLPTKENLKKIQRALTNECPRCGEVESLEHVLFFCPHAEKVWWLSTFGYCPKKEGFVGFEKWWQEICEMLKKDERPDLIPMIAQVCNSIWHARNHLIFDNVEQDPEQVWIKASTKCYDDPVLNTELGNNGNLSELETKWKKPEPSAIKINCATSHCNDTTYIGVAALGRDCNGVVMDAFSSCVKTYSQRVAEAAAIRAACQLVEKNNWYNAIIESTNIGLIRSLQLKLLNSWDSKATESAILCTAQTRNIRFNYCRKNLNRATIWIAKNSRLNHCNMLNASLIPDQLKTLIELDNAL